MKTFKKLNNKTIKFLKENKINLNGIIYKPYTICDIPNSFGEYGTHWFNHKGLTYLIK